MKFKIGDKVRIKDNLREIKDFVGGYIDHLEEYVGDIVTIKKIDTSTLSGKKGARVKENDWFWDFRAFEKIGGDNMKKADLKNGDIVTLRNEDRLVYIRGNFRDLSTDNDNPITSAYNFNEDLTYDYSRREYDIVKVERPVKYKTVFEREEVKEMTVDEISEKLGYKVKVVGEDR